MASLIGETSIWPRVPSIVWYGQIIKSFFACCCSRWTYLIDQSGWINGTHCMLVTSSTVIGVKGCGCSPVLGSFHQELKKIWKGRCVSSEAYTELILCAFA